MRVLYVSPCYFSRESVIAGGERYAYEVAQAMANRAEVVFLSFAERPTSFRDGPLQVERLRRSPGRWAWAAPVSWRFAKWIRWADVIHCYQAHMISTNLAVVLGKVWGKKVFVTDLAGASRYAPSYHLPILRQADAFLVISEFNKKRWDRAPWPSRPRALTVISGGVDPARFSPGDGRKSNTVLCVGRIAPFRGIHVLIEALEGTVPLEVVGHIHDRAYLDHLRALSAGKRVLFHTDLSDEQLIQQYRNAQLTVVPNLVDGGFTTVFESFACGTPVLATTVGSLPEIIEDGVTGFLVPPNDAAALRAKIAVVMANPAVAQEMGRRAREVVLRRFTWERVAARCAEAYGQGAARWERSP